MGWLLYFQTELAPLLVMRLIISEKCVWLLTMSFQSSDYTCSLCPLVLSPPGHSVSH